MARHSAWENPLVLRLMGLSLIAILIGALALTGALFNKSFVRFDDVKLVSDKSGLDMNVHGDVKLRGMIVGTVREIRRVDGKSVMTLGMDPKLIGRIPSDLRVEIIPKTLFGEKYISLIPTGSGPGGHLHAGDTIYGATVPVEVEEFFNDVYPILVAVPPEKVSYTLTALAKTLEGRGDSLGETLDITNDYLKKLNPDTQQAVDDIVDLGKVSDTYAGQMDNFGEFLNNAAKISDTVVDKRKDLADFFDETDELSDVLRDFLAASGDDIVATVHNSVQPLKISSDYSSMFPCWFRGLDTFLREHMDSILRNGTLHIDLKMVYPQATVYDVNTERPTIPEQSVIDRFPQVSPHRHAYDDQGRIDGLGTVCDELNAAAAGHPVRSHDNPLIIPGWGWKFVGIKNSHNGKLGTDADYNRSGLGTSNLSGIDSPAQRQVLDRMTTALTGVKTTDVPDVASLLLSPVIRGAGIAVDAR